MAGLSIGGRPVQQFFIYRLPLIASFLYIVQRTLRSALADAAVELCLQSLCLMGPVIAKYGGLVYNVVVGGSDEKACVKRGE
jgi:hypothetical protein